MNNSNDNNKNKEGKPELTKKGFSRRGFLKGASLTTAGTMIASTGVLGMDAQNALAEDNTIGPDAVLMSIKVNGKVKRVKAEPRTTLAELLRNHLQLTGTKVVCDRGSCSACTVWVDGLPVNSCTTMAFDIGDKEVTTIEGIAKNGELHPIQEAFIEHDASQCGFCTPGMIMSTANLLKNNSNPSLDDVKSAVRGNLCRCGTHPHVFKATLDAASKM
jgi:carbon-monoxide dehydrogenase small subunit/xanthine dehydrogenase YagT iron-sulfur-binding subunit